MALGMSESHAIEKGNRGLNEGSQLASNSDLWNREPPLRQLTGEATILTDGYNLVGPRFDTSGFSALPGGCWDGSGKGDFVGKFHYCHFWSSTESSEEILPKAHFLMSRRLKSLSQGVVRERDYCVHGFSVRLVKD